MITPTILVHKIEPHERYCVFYHASLDFSTQVKPALSRLGLPPDTPCIRITHDHLDDAIRFARWDGQHACVEI